MSILAAGGTFVALVGLLKALSWLVPQVHAAFVKSSAISHFEIYAVILLIGGVVFNFRNQKNVIKQILEEIHTEIKESKEEAICESTKLVEERIGELKSDLQMSSQRIDMLFERQDERFTELQAEMRQNDKRSQESFSALQKILINMSVHAASIDGL